MLGGHVILSGAKLNNSVMVLCKSLEPPLISLYFASNESDFLVIFKVVLRNTCADLPKGLSKFFTFFK